MKNCDLLLLTGAVTGLWDISARMLAENDLYNFPVFGRQEWIISLQPYFEKKTVLGAALIAGFVGLVSQWIILSIVPFPRAWADPNDLDLGSLFGRTLLVFMLVTAAVSGGVGFVMQYAGLFPDLTNTMYKTLGPSRSRLTDTVSGIIVQTTILALVKLGLFRVNAA